MPIKYFFWVLFIVFLFSVKEVAKDSTEACQIADKNVAKITSKTANILTPSEQQLLVDYLKKEVSTSHGIKAEKETAKGMAEISAIENSVFQEDQNYYSCSLLSTGLYTYQIVGRIDGLEVRPDGTLVLVEIKNRMRKLFYRLRDYENIQIQTYLYLTNLNHAKLVEQYNQQVNIIEVSREEKLYKTEILPKLKDFALKLDSILTDPKATRDFLSSINEKSSKS